MKLSHKLMSVSAAALMAVSPLMSVSSNVLAAKTTKTTTSKEVLVLEHDAAVYNANGTRNKNYKYGKKSYPVIGKGAKLNGYGTKTIKGETYYFIGNNSYIKAANVATVNGKALSKTSSAVQTTKKTGKKSTTKTAKKSTKKVNKKETKKSVKKTSGKMVTIRRAQVYDKNGKKAKTYYGSKKYTVIGKNITLNNAGSKIINGVKYYALQANRYYVKASDVKLK